MIASSGTFVYRETMKNLDLNSGKEVMYLLLVAKSLIGWVLK